MHLLSLSSLCGPCTVKAFVEHGHALSDALCNSKVSSHRQEHLAVFGKNFTSGGASAWSEYSDASIQPAYHTRRCCACCCPKNNRSRQLSRQPRLTASAKRARNADGECQWPCSCRGSAWLNEYASWSCEAVMVSQPEGSSPQECDWSTGLMMGCICAQYMMDHLHQEIQRQKLRCGETDAPSQMMCWPDCSLSARN